MNSTQEQKRIKVELNSLSWHLDSAMPYQMYCQIRQLKSLKLTVNTAPLWKGSRVICGEIWLGFDIKAKSTEKQLTLLCDFMLYHYNYSTLDPQRSISTKIRLLSMIKCSIMHCRYLATIFLQQIPKGHRIACPSGRVMGCPLWLRNLKKKSAKVFVVLLYSKSYCIRPW